MKRYLPIILIFAVTVAAQAKELDPRTLAQFNLKMAIISQDGKRVGDKLVKYAIFKVDKEWKAVWDEVYFSNNQGEVDLQMSHYSTNDGTIVNVRVSDDFASFDIKPSLVNGALIHVICTPPKEYLCTPNVKATAVYQECNVMGVVHPKHTDQWVLTERIVLPSTEVFGSPLPSKEKRE